MEMQEYSVILSRIGRHAADDLDDLISQFEPRPRVAGSEVFPELEAAFMPDVCFKREDAVCIGFQTEGELDDAADRASRMAAMALERDVEVILLTSGGLSGLERFGFRSEAIAGRTDSARATCLDQVRRFWRLDLVL